MKRHLLFVVFGIATLLQHSRVESMCCPVPCLDCWMTSQAQLNLVQMDRLNGRVHLVPNIAFQGLSADFALIVPTPTLPEFDEAPREIWEEARQLTRPMPSDGSNGVFGCGTAGVAVLAPAADDAEAVFVHSRQTVGAFEVTVLSSDDPQALVRWLNENGFALPAEDVRRFEPFVARGWFFTTMKLDTASVVMPPEGWNSDVNPIRVTYAATTFELALPIIAINRAASMPVVVYVVDDHRMNLEGFETLYANSIEEREYRGIVAQYPHLGGYLAAGKWFTALQRTFTATESMDESVHLKPNVRDEEYRRGTRFGAVPVSVLALLLGLMCLRGWARWRKLEG